MRCKDELFLSIERSIDEDFRGPALVSPLKRREIEWVGRHVQDIWSIEKSQILPRVKHDDETVHDNTPRFRYTYTFNVGNIFGTRRPAMPIGGYRLANFIAKAALYRSLYRTIWTIVSFL